MVLNDCWEHKASKVSVWIYVSSDVKVNAKGIVHAVVDVKSIAPINPQALEEGEKDWITVLA